MSNVNKTYVTSPSILSPIYTNPKLSIIIKQQKLYVEQNNDTINFTVSSFNPNKNDRSKDTDHISCTPTEITCINKIQPSIDFDSVLIKAKKYTISNSFSFYVSKINHSNKNIFTLEKPIYTHKAIVQKRTIANGVTKSTMAITTNFDLKKKLTIGLPSKIINVVSLKTDYNIVNTPTKDIFVYRKIIVNHPYKKCMFDVKDKTFTIKPSTNAKSNIETMQFVIQKQSFIQMYIKFSKENIDMATGLPEGLYLDGDYIKGTPLIAGEYKIDLLSKNKSIMKIIIKVTNIPRQL